MIPGQNGQQKGWNGWHDMFALGGLEVGGHFGLNLRVSQATQWKFGRQLGSHFVPWLDSGRACQIPPFFWGIKLDANICRFLKGICPCRLIAYSAWFGFGHIIWWYIMTPTFFRIFCYVTSYITVPFGIFFETRAHWQFIIACFSWRISKDLRRKKETKLGSRSYNPLKYIHPLKIT